VDWPAEARRYADALTPAVRDRLAALPLLGLRDGGRGPVYVIPEADATGAVVGLNRRFPDGSKTMLPGGRRGLILPAGWRERPGPVFLVEGPTDAAAMTVASLTAVGRPSNTGGVAHLADLLGDLDPGPAVVVVGENDRKPTGDWPGRYQRGGFLVHVLDQPAEPDPDAVVRRPVGAPVVRELARPLLRERLTRAATWRQWRGSGENAELVPAHPPDGCVGAVHAHGHWPAVRPLDAVLTHPVLLPTGDVLAADGYHRGVRVLTRLPPDLTVAVPDTPTRADVTAAVATLLDPLADFPFETPAHRAALVAGLLTPLAWFLIDGNVRGVGKGLLADVVALTVTGRRFPVMSYTSDREELRKKITTPAMEGERLVLLDNLAGAVGNDVLDAALTTDRWKDRVLGGNRVYDGPLQVVWFGTGNNVQLGADTSRRVCHARLESADERPEMKEGFRHADLRGARPPHPRWAPVGGADDPVGVGAGGATGPRAAAVGEFRGAVGGGAGGGGVRRPAGPRGDAGGPPDDGRPGRGRDGGRPHRAGPARRHRAGADHGRPRHPAPGGGEGAGGRGAGEPAGGGRGSVREAVRADPRVPVPALRPAELRGADAGQGGRPARVEPVGGAGRGGPGRPGGCPPPPPGRGSHRWDGGHGGDDPARSGEESPPPARSRRSYANDDRPHELRG
jgi:hypothetical protein